MANSSDLYDAIVVGGGNAAINAALAVRHAGKRVLLLERGSEHMRGGNTRHTRNIRCAHDAADDYCNGPYTAEVYLQDLIRQGAPANLDLAKYTIDESMKLPQWMSEHGITWQAQLYGIYRISDLMSFSFGYRAIGDNYQTGSGTSRFLYNATIFGPVLRFAFTF